MFIFFLMMSFDRTQVRRGPPETSPQQTGTSRTVKRYPSSSAPITSNALPSNNGFTSSRGGVQNWSVQRNGHSSTHSANTHRPGNDNLLHGHFNNALSPAGKLHKRICSFLFGNTCKRLAAFIKKNISRKENKQNSWTYWIFPTVAPPRHICGLHQDRRADVCYQQHLSMLVCVCPLLIHAAQSGRERVPERAATLISPGICRLSGRDRCLGLRLPATKKKRDPQFRHFASFPATIQQAQLSALRARLISQSAPE